GCWDHGRPRFRGCETHRGSSAGTSSLSPPYPRVRTQKTPEHKRTQVRTNAHPNPDPAPQPRQKRTTTKDHSSPGPLYGPDLLMPTIGAHPTTRSSPDPSTPSPREQSPLLTPAHPVTPTLPICPPPHRRCWPARLRYPGSGSAHTAPLSPPPARLPPVHP